MSDERPLTDPASSPSSPMQRLPRLTPGVGFTLLDGVRIVDLTTSIAGPFATQLLADFGAEIVKVERRGSGDDARAWGRHSWMAKRFGSFPSIAISAASRWTTQSRTERPCCANSSPAPTSSF